MSPQSKTDSHKKALDVENGFKLETIHKTNASKTF